MIEPTVKRMGFLALGALLLILGFLIWGVLPGIHMLVLALVVAYGMRPIK